MFRNEDLITWNGLITYWAIIKTYVSPSDCVQFATEEEITLYNAI